MQTLWRRPILNTQGGVLLWVDSPVWSEKASGGEGRCQSVTGDRDSSFLRFFFPLPPPFAPSPLLPTLTMAARRPRSRAEAFTDARVTGGRGDNELEAPQAHISTGAQSGRPGTLSALSQSPPRMTHQHRVALLSKAQRAEVVSL